MGKLYLNYPMVEAFYHMTETPDSDYISRYATLEEPEKGEYKTRVNKENRNHDCTKFAVDRNECNTVIKQNIEKGFVISGKKKDTLLPDLDIILEKQINNIETMKRVFVLCTCAFYITDYNSNLIE